MSLLPTAFAVRGLLLVLALAAAGNAPAADSAGNYAIWPLGASSCHRFAKTAGDDAQRQPYRDFLTGYLTAYNTLAENTYNALGKMKLSAAVAWLDGYCDLHKLDGFERAVQQLITAHHAQRKQHASGQRSWGRVPPPAAPTDAAGGDFGPAGEALNR